MSRALLATAGAILAVTVSVPCTSADPPLPFDRLGDPLPDGARARLGTRRLAVDALGAAFSPDGASIASVGQDEGLQVWRLVDGKPVDEVKDCRGSRGVEYSPDGKLLLCERYGRLLVWDLNRHGIVRTLPGSAPFAFSGDGARIAAAAPANDNGRRPGIHVFETETGDEVAGLPADDVTSIVFTSDALGIVAGVGRGRVRIWKIANPHQPELQVDTEVRGVVEALSEGGRFAAVVCFDDATVRIWDLTTQREQARIDLGFDRFANRGPHVRFSPSATVLAVADGYGTLQLYEVSNVVASRQMMGHCRSRMAFSPDGTFLAGSDGRRLRVWNAATGGEQLPMPGEVGLVDRLMFSKDGSLLFAGGPEASAGRLWSVRDAKQILALPARALSVVISTETQILVTAEWQRLQFWDLSTGTERGAVDIWSAGYVRALAVLDGGKAVASGSARDGLIRLWDTSSRRLLAEFPGSSTRGAGRHPLELESSVDGSVLMSLHGDEARLWEGIVPGRSPGHSHRLTKGWDVVGIAVSGDGRRVATAKRQAITVWSTHPRRRVGRFTPPEGTGGVALSHDGGLIASHSYSSLEIYDTKLNRLVARAAGPHLVGQAKFSPDGTLLAVGYGNGEILLWDVQRLIDRGR